MAAEVAYTLLDIFLTFGAPHILQSDNGREFTAGVIRELASLWPGLVLVHGRPCHPQSQGSIERANGDVKNMLSAWVITIKPPNGQKDYVLFNSLKTDLTTVPSINLLMRLCLVANQRWDSATPTSPGIFCRIYTQKRTLRRELTEQQSDESQGEPVTKIPVDDPQGVTVEAELHIEAEADVQAEAGVQTEAEVQSEAEVQIEAEVQSEAELNTTQPPTLNAFDDEDDFVQPNPLRSPPPLTSINQSREKAKRGLECQADQMIRNTCQRLQEATTGDNVLIEIPAVDRGPLDGKNLHAVVLSHSENGYELGTTHGKINRLYSRNMFEKVSSTNLAITDVPDKEICLREIVRQVSFGQGHFHCSCKLKCSTLRCKYVKAKRKCNSRFHNSLSYQNK